MDEHKDSETTLMAVGSGGGDNDPEKAQKQTIDDGDENLVHNQKHVIPIMIGKELEFSLMFGKGQN